MTIEPVSISMRAHRLHGIGFKPNSHSLRLCGETPTALANADLLEWLSLAILMISFILVLSISISYGIALSFVNKFMELPYLKAKL